MTNYYVIGFLTVITVLGSSAIIMWGYMFYRVNREIQKRFDYKGPIPTDDEWKKYKGILKAPEEMKK